MKRVPALSMFLLAATLLVFVQCKKDKDKTPLEQLPPETQTGANTFGCLVNGEDFKPGGAQLSGGSLQANYQDLGSGPGGGIIWLLLVDLGIIQMEVAQVLDFFLTVLLYKKICHTLC